ncbi:MAG TPA: DUF4398 domain-containing protein [Myxococcota bacterium]|nr:DUF4398 domain-containing protein [Myxococcota bacterium]
MDRMWASLAVAALLATACASMPAPTGEVAKADLAVNKADAVNAAEVDPLDMRLAREKLEKSKLEMKEENYIKARRLAESAEADAMVAEAKARATRAQQAVQQLEQDANSLKSGASAGGTQK